MDEENKNLFFSFGIPFHNTGVGDSHTGKKHIQSFKTYKELIIT